MLDYKQKKTLIIIATAIFLLGVVTFWHKPNYRYVEKNNNVQSDKQFVEQYQKYLASLKLDQKASQAIFQKIMTEEDVKKEVETALQTYQKIEIPDITNNEIKLTQKTGQQVVTDYLQKSATISWTLRNQASTDSKNMFAKNSDSNNSLSGYISKQITNLKNLPVPSETLNLQKNQLAALSAYQELSNVSSLYANGQIQDPWPKLYKQYYIINESLRSYNQNLNTISDKYKLTNVPITLNFADDGENSSNNKFSVIPTAHAQFGTISTTIGDIPRIIRDALQDGLEASFAQFMGTFIQQLLQKIESNYMISNFLYYSDALVSGQYADDYLNKYVSTDFDKKIIKQMLPQFNCNQENPEMQKVFQAKASEYLGFDPKNLSPSDPLFNSKLARVGDFLSEPQGWQTYYQNLAQQTESEAQKSVSMELSSSGLKTPRDITQKSISLSISSIVSAKQAALGAMMNLGISTAKNYISQFVSTLVQTLMNQFVFRGASTVRGGTAIGVLKEQATCLATAQVEAIVPLGTTNYTAPSSTPSESELLKEQCAKYPSACKATTPIGQYGQ